jgi:hypothetical protein
MPPVRRGLPGAAARLALLVGVAACARLTATPSPIPADALPRRLVLALDGIDYRDLAAQHGAGRFAGFRPPSRLVSTFPSISDVAWHDILGLLPPAGYQRVYFSHATGGLVGRPIDAITPIEYEERMDQAFGGRFHHLSAYLISGRVARQEVDEVVEAFWRTRGRATVYAYNVGPDALQHTRGDLEGYLRHLDRRLATLQRDYRARTGRPLEIVLLSDHGHNRAVGANFLPLVEALADAGFRVRGRLEAPEDVALSVDGVTTGFGIFAAPTVVDRVAHTVADVAGVDVVTWQGEGGRIHVRQGRAVGMIERDPRAPSRLAWRVSSGDPLAHAAVVQRLARDGRLDAEGFAEDSVWVRASLDAPYPAALPRIVRGHEVITLNPAPILVSVAATARVGFGMVSVANRLRPLGGTHGALDTSSALGVVMTTFRDTHDDVTWRVRAQLDDFADLDEPHGGTTAVRLTTGTRLVADPRGHFRAVALPDDARGAGLLVRLDDPALDDATPLIIEVRRPVRGLPDVVTVARAATTLGVALSGDGPAPRFLPLSPLGLALPSNAAVALHLFVGGDGEGARAYPPVAARTDGAGRVVVP